MALTDRCSSELGTLANGLKPSQDRRLIGTTFGGPQTMPIESQQTSDDNYSPPIGKAPFMHYNTAAATTTAAAAAAAASKHNKRQRLMPLSMQVKSQQVNNHTNRRQQVERPAGQLTSQLKRSQQQQLVAAPSRSGPNCWSKQANKHDGGQDYASSRTYASLAPTCGGYNDYYYSPTNSTGLEPQLLLLATEHEANGTRNAHCPNEPSLRHSQRVSPPQGQFVEAYPSWRRARSPAGSQSGHMAFHVPSGAGGSNIALGRLNGAPNQPTRFGYVTPADGQRETQRRSTSLGRRRPPSLAAYKSRTVAHLPNLLGVSVAGSTRAQHRHAQTQYHDKNHRQQQEQQQSGQLINHEDFYERPSPASMSNSASCQFVVSEGNLVRAHLVPVNQSECGSDNPFRPGTRLHREGDIMAKLLSQFPPQSLAEQLAVVRRYENLASHSVSPNTDRLDVTHGKKYGTVIDNSRLIETAKKKNVTRNVLQVGRSKSMPKFFDNSNELSSSAEDSYSKAPDSDSVDQLIRAAEPEIRCLLRNKSYETNAITTTTTTTTRNTTTNRYNNETSQPDQTALRSESNWPTEPYETPPLAKKAAIFSATGQQIFRRPENQIAGKGERKSQSTMGERAKSKKQRASSGSNQLEVSPLASKKTNNSIRKKGFDCCHIQ